MARRIVTRQDVEAARAAGRLELDPEAVVTEAARELAARSGVTLVQEGLAPLPPLAPPVAETPPEPQGDSCIVTAVGRDRPFILAEITTRIGQLQGNITDITQRIVGGYFSAVFVVDLAAGEPFGSFKRELEALSKQGDYRVVVQHERIFKAMHRL